VNVGGEDALKRQRVSVVEQCCGVTICAFAVRGVSLSERRLVVVRSGRGKGTRVESSEVCRKRRVVVM